MKKKTSDKVYFSSASFMWECCLMIWDTRVIQSSWFACIVSASSCCLSCVSYVIVWNRAAQFFTQFSLLLNVVKISCSWNTFSCETKENLKWTKIKINYFLYIFCNLHVYNFFDWYVDKISAIEWLKLLKNWKPDV